MNKDAKDWLILGGLLAAVYAVSRVMRTGSLFGLGAADPAKLDVSRAEDLAGAAAELIGLEGHLASTAGQTGDQKYLAALDRVREMRRDTMARLLPMDAEGEAWCSVKHCLAASVRLTESATKYLSDGKRDEAQKLLRMAREAKDAALMIARGSESGVQCEVCRGG